MITQNKEKQGKLVLTTLEELMPEEHFLRDLESLVDFTFVYDKIEHYHSTIIARYASFVFQNWRVIGRLNAVTNRRKPKYKKRTQKRRGFVRSH